MNTPRRKLARFHAGEEALPEYTHPEAAATSREPEEHHRSSRRNSCDRQYDFKANEDAMRAASAARWGKDERLCLESAFSLQLKRLEVPIPIALSSTQRGRIPLDNLS